MKQLLFLVSLACLALVTACQHKAVEKTAIEEDLEAKKMLQGVWINDGIEDVAFRIQGDTVYYPDSTSVPVYFYVAHDTLVMKGSNEVKYPIQKLAEHLFIFKSTTGDVVKLVKTDDKSYLQQFTDETPIALNQNTLIKRDTVVLAGDVRLHLYVQINPTTYKVYQSSLNNDGVEVDNVWYDNIINVNVFEGNCKLFSRDFHKKDFSRYVPKEFLEQAILTDMVYGSSSEEGVVFFAVLAKPDSSLSYQVEVSISRTGKLTVRQNGK